MYGTAGTASTGGTIHQDGVVDYGEMSPTDWTRPNDFEHGRFYIRFEVIEQPTDSAFKVQLGFWQDKDKEGGHSETIASSLYMQGGAGDLLEKDAGTPSRVVEQTAGCPGGF